MFRGIHPDQQTQIWYSDHKRVYGTHPSGTERLQNPVGGKEKKTQTSMKLSLTNSAYERGGGEGGRGGSTLTSVLS